jgi:hypothetical protein
VQRNISRNEVEMSDDKQGRARRVAPPQVTTEAVGEPAAPAVPEPAHPQPIAAAPALPEPVPALPAPTPAAPRTGTDRFLSAYRETLASIGQAQAAVASDVAAMALEIEGRARSNLTAAGDSATALLRAKSLVDVVEIQIGFARRSLDAMVETSTRLSEIGLRLANDAAKPMLGRLAG